MHASTLFTVLAATLLSAAGTVSGTTYTCDAKPWPITPPLLICDGHGTLAHPAPLDGAYASDLTSCASDCLNSLSCLTFEFNQTTSQCQLLKNLFIFQGYLPSNKNTSEVYYDKFCFWCDLVPVNGTQPNGTYATNGKYRHNKF